MELEKRPVSTRNQIYANGLGATLTPLDCLVASLPFNAQSFWQVERGFLLLFDAFRKCDFNRALDVVPMLALNAGHTYGSWFQQWRYLESRRDCRDS